MGFLGGHISSPTGNGEAKMLHLDRTSASPRCISSSARSSWCPSRGRISSSATGSKLKSHSSSCQRFATCRIDLGMHYGSQFLVQATGRELHLRSWRSGGSGTRSLRSIEGVFWNLVRRRIEPKMS